MAALPRRTWGSRVRSTYRSAHPHSQRPAPEVPVWGLRPGPLIVPKGAQWKGRLPVAFQGSTHLGSSTQSSRGREEPRVQEGKLRHNAVVNPLAPETQVDQHTGGT